MDDQKKNISDFLAAAKREAAGVLTPEEQLKEKERASLRAEQQDFYDQVIKPLADALCALPEKDGKKFSTSVRSDESTGTPVLRIRLFHHDATDIKPEFSATTKKIIIDLHDKDIKNELFLICLAYEDASSSDTKDMSPKTLDETPAALGKWVASVAPDRLAEIEAALQSKPRMIALATPLQYKKRP